MLVRLRSLPSGFCAWPLHGVVFPGEAETLHFGYCFSERRGLQYCDWELRVTLSNGAAKSAGPPSADAAGTAYTTRISIAALVSASPLPVEGLWYQGSKASRWQAVAAAEEVVQLLLEETLLCATKPEEVSSCGLTLLHLAHQTYELVLGGGAVGYGSKTPFYFSTSYRKLGINAHPSYCGGSGPIDEQHCSAPPDTVDFHNFMQAWRIRWLGPLYSESPMRI